jgi:enoyl-CoA hydratase
LEPKNIIVEKRGKVGIITLNRPAVKNALNTQLMQELVDALKNFEQDSDVNAVVITGSSQFFSSGADIREMAEKGVSETYLSGLSEYWQSVAHFKKPLIAAVNGYAYGGGLELVMACDIVVCSEDAKFAQPEIKLGIMPGAGGTQRLPRIVGKHRALEMILTGEPISAQEAYMLGLVNKVVPQDAVKDEALRIAELIAEKAPVAVRAAKEAVVKGLDMGVEEGLAFERSLFSLLFGTQDQKEGMKAFIEKRKPEFKGR